MVTTSTGQVETILAGVPDPEIPALSIVDLGIVRRVERDGHAVRVVVTPTYSGCPAMEAIIRAIHDALGRAGFGKVDVVTELFPPWSTSDMSEAGRDALASSDISPPGRPVLCPQCRSDEVRTISEFGSTACKALMVCSRCGEPFSRFKEL